MSKKSLQKLSNLLKGYFEILFVTLVGWNLFGNHVSNKQFWKWVHYVDVAIKSYAISP